MSSPSAACTGASTRGLRRVGDGSSPRRGKGLGAEVGGRGRRSVGETQEPSPRPWPLRLASEVRRLGDFFVVGERASDAPNTLA